MGSRAVARVVPSVGARDGAGVSLRRVFGYRERGLFDPFLMLDHFGSDDPRDYMAGFPWHPHRGIETVTYLAEGRVEHGDSMGNKGVIGPGDAQWMTAGSGIIHQEMPAPGRDGKTVDGFQLWVNLPAALKMSSPRYRAVDSGEIPRVKVPGGEVAVLAGSYGTVAGATPDLFVPVRYFIVTLEAGASLSMRIPASHNSGAYLYRGSADIGGTRVGSGDIAAIPATCSPDDDEIRFGADSETGASFLFISGEPLNESIAWGGPIVMNTQAELDLAFEEYRRGTFVKR